VLILLPPSEGKTAPAAGPPLDLSSLSLPGLTPVREQVLDDLIRLCAQDEDRAASVLGLGPKQRADVAANARLRSSPCAPAIEVYSGVLYDSLDLGSLPRRARTRANAHLLISSGLWGLVRPTDPIPAYRLSGSVTLPRLGTLAGVWRGPVTDQLAATDELIVDLRSSTYLSLGPVPRSAAERAVTVRVLQERDGRRSVVSHSNKATKGRVVRALLESPRLPATVRGFIAALRTAGFRVEDAGTGSPRIIDVVVDHA
jgi:uncharacterized protein